MDSSVMEFLGSFFTSIWNMLGAISVPGTELTLQHCLVAPIAVAAFVEVMKKFLDNGAVSSSSAHSVIREENIRAEKESRSDEYHSSRTPYYDRYNKEWRFR